MQKIIKKIKTTLRNKFFLGSLFFTPLFLSLTNYYIPWGGHPFHEALMGGALFGEFERLVKFYPESILWMCLIIIALFLVVPRKYSKWIFFVYFGLILLLIASSY